MKYTTLFLFITATSRLCAQDWSTLGNAGTNASTNFIGTTDNVPLVFRVNNIQSGRIDQVNRSAYFGHDVANNIALLAGTENGQNNAAFGHRALAANTSGGWNCAMGTLALESNTSGASNAAFGMNALNSNTSGESNASFGAWSLQANTTGARNSVLGVLALNNNTTGSDNVALGSSALAANKAGGKGVAIGTEAMARANNSTVAFNNLNVAIGYQAMYGSVSSSANTGNRNTALGYQTLVDYTTGNENTALGTQALFIATTGSANTAVGNLALGSLTTGNNCTAVGRLANVSTGTLNNATALGYNTTVSASNKVRLGNSSITVVEGQVPYTSPSDARFKRDVEEDVQGLSFILRLRPVSYTFDRAAFAKHVGEDVTGREKELAELSQQRTVGFLAQEVEKNVQNAGFTAFDAVHVPAGSADNYGLAYAEFVVPLVKAVQELHAENQALREQVERLERAVAANDHVDALHVFPVPARDAFKVNVPASDVGMPAVIELYDASGRLVLANDVKALASTVPVELPSRIKAGTYVLNLRVLGGTVRIESERDGLMLAQIEG